MSILSNGVEGLLGIHKKLSINKVQKTWHFGAHTSGVTGHTQDVRMEGFEMVSEGKVFFNL